ncbi:Major Facilitator Superfamily protein [Rhizoctonia solani AG-1 IA]|uniref:Major Facilitator Superfamily protein n=1 Tax=Thanatephorus cucumeris (strain AG1-IA) TaxID=983506 RepID=L8WZ73_THACA|nr:Major Facilitator Superfamily protein [Rhizoctonia solani AG-1 IA]
MAHQEHRSELRIETGKINKAEVSDVGQVVEVGSISERERKVVRKVSGPYLTWTGAVDLGNAKLQGLEADLIPNDPSGERFGLLSAIFCDLLRPSIGYMIDCYGRKEFPMMLIVKRFPPNRVIGIVTIMWGISSALQASAFDYAGVVTARYFMGLFEAGFGPVIPFYYSLFYLKSEHALRTSFFISAGPLAGAFGGIIAYGVQTTCAVPNTRINSHNHSSLVEGCPTILVGILVLIFLPARPESTKWLSEEERTIATERLQREVQSEARAVNWDHVRLSLLDYRTWMLSILYQSLNVALSSISVFLPTIIRTLGYTNAKAQLMSVPPYACAGVVMLVVAKMSDRLRLRGPFVAGSLVHARYAAIFLAVTGTYCGIPIAMSWTTGNGGSETRRAVNMAMLNTIGQAMAVLGSYIYPEREAPQYIRGFAICCGFAWWGFLISCTLSGLWWLENRRRDRMEGGRPEEGIAPDTALHADKAVGFRYVI